MKGIKSEGEHALRGLAAMPVMSMAEETTED